MNCMKCGRELESDNAFCTDCLLEMEKYPVNSELEVFLPNRQEKNPGRKAQPKRRTVSPEEQIRVLKKRLWFLCGILLVTLALIAAMAYPTVNYFIRGYNLRPGQNYKTVSTTETTEATEEIVK